MGCPRSGTTLLNQLLNSHPKIALTNEMNLIALSEEMKKTLFRKEVRLSEKPIDREKSPRENWKFEDLMRFIPKHKNAVFSVLESVCLSIKNDQDIIYFGDKLPQYYRENLSDFADYLDETIYVIYVTRSVADVVSSMMRRYENAKKGKDYWSSVTSVNDGLIEWVMAWNSRREFAADPNIKMLDFNYDMLIKHKHDACELMADFLSIANDFDEGLVSDRPVKSNISKEQILSIAPYLGKIIDQWHDYDLDLKGNYKQLPYPPPENRINRKAARRMISRVIGKMSGLRGLKKLVSKSNKFSPLTRSDLLMNSCKFIVNECVEGDYYEFGVYRGQTLVSAYLDFQRIVNRRLKNSINIGENIDADIIRTRMRDQMMFHAFDSFEGLPELSSDDVRSTDFSAAQFASASDNLIRLAMHHGMPQDRLQLHKGWFEETCTPEYARKNKLKKASIIWLDCDLHSSAMSAFRIIECLLQDGTVLIVDDWYSFKGSRFYGVQKAFYTWTESESVKNKFYFNEYRKDSWKRMSFIVNEIPNSND